MSRLAALLLLSSATAMAQRPPADGDGDSGDERKERLADRNNWFNLRAGLSSADQNDRPVICLEVAVHWGLSVEGCGTGAGILHHDDGGELAHFRAKYSLIERKTLAGKLRGQVGAGFAELQLGDDEPGFNFGDPDGSDSAAGPEGALALQLLTHIGRGFELVTSASAGVAVIPGADRLSAPQPETQLFASFEIGIGW